MSLRNEIELFTKLSGEDGQHTSIGRIGAYLDGYEKGKSEIQWIPCSERLPEKETVLATVETKTFKHRYVCEAVWISRWTWKASFDNWEDCSEYNEDEDEYYVLEGWYERVHNWDDYSYVGIEDDVIAWRPLPEPYREEGEQP